ncbi:MAG TPA: hypothetical protein VFU50_18330 [Terriglobales bacterium]|nr:hypothetical protein [Terriglobales bacterium]
MPRSPPQQPQRGRLLGTAIARGFRGVPIDEALQQPLMLRVFGLSRSLLRRYYGQRNLHPITISCNRRKPLVGTARSRDVFLQSLEEYRFEVIPAAT